MPVSGLARTNGSQPILCGRNIRSRQTGRIPFVSIDLLISRRAQARNISVIIKNDQLFLYRKQDFYMGLSFATISSSGPNASIIHYHPEVETNRQITADEIYLCDSGAQYKYDGFLRILHRLNIQAQFSFCLDNVGMAPPM